MGSGGSGSSGGSSGSGGSPVGGGWGPTMGSGGNAYGRGGVGGIGTAGTMSSGAGGSAMGGFGNTGAGGSGMAGISTHSGETPAGFTPAYGDPRGLALGMNANGTYGGVGIRENGQTVLGYRKVTNPGTKQVEYRTVIQRVTPSTKNPGFGYDQFGRLVKMSTAAPAPAPARPSSSPGIGPTNVTSYGASGPGGTIGYGQNLGSLGSMNPGVGYSGYAGYAGSGYGGYPSSTSFGMGLGGGGRSAPSQGGIQGSPAGPGKQGPTGNVRGGGI